MTFLIIIRKINKGRRQFRKRCSALFVIVFHKSTCNLKYFIGCLLGDFKQKVVANITTNVVDELSQAMINYLPKVNVENETKVKSETLANDIKSVNGKNLNDGVTGSDSCESVDALPMNRLETQAQVHCSDKE